MNYLLLAGAAAAVWFASARRSASMIKAYVTNVELSLQGLTPILTLKMNVENPTALAITVTGYSGTAYIQKDNSWQPVGDIISSEPNTIKAGGTSNISVVVRLNPTQLIGLFGAQSLGISEPERMPAGLKAGGTVASLPPQPALTVVNNPKFRTVLPSVEVLNPATGGAVTVREPESSRTNKMDESQLKRMSGLAMAFQGVTVKYDVRLNTTVGGYSITGTQKIV